jgi:hypothetical protein
MAEDAATVIGIDFDGFGDRGQAKGGTPKKVADNGLEVTVGEPGVRLKRSEPGRRLRRDLERWTIWHHGDSPDERGLPSPRGPNPTTF